MKETNESEVDYYENYSNHNPLVGINLAQEDLNFLQGKNLLALLQSHKNTNGHLPKNDQIELETLENWQKWLFNRKNASYIPYQEFSNFEAKKNELIQLELRKKFKKITEKELQRLADIKNWFSAISIDVQKKYISFENYIAETYKSAVESIVGRTNNLAF